LARALKIEDAQMDVGWMAAVMPKDAISQTVCALATRRSWSRQSSGM
jgi:hypothetical protein